jgi:hypothetical protein
MQNCRASKTVLLFCRGQKSPYVASVQIYSAGNLYGDRGGASCASEIDLYRIGMLAAFSNWSDLPTILMTFPRKVRCKFTSLLVPTLSTAGKPNP